ncbi:TPA: MucBP domain-containing protein [Enterococcus faecalis]|nr:MucBP domain-containing protein [Enterococcus faecalis]
MDNNGKSKKDGSRMWKSSKKWVASSGAVVITLFGPANVAGAAEIVATELSKTDVTSEVENKETEESSLINSAPTSDSSTSTSEDSSPEESKNEDTSESSIVADSSSIEKESNQEIVPVAASNLTLDMNPDTGTPEDSINYSLTNDGAGWPDRAGSAKQLTVAGQVNSGDIIKVTIGKGVEVTELGAPEGMSASKKVIDGVTEITYTSTVSAVVSFDISYYFHQNASLAEENIQLSPGDTIIPVTLVTENQSLNGKIIANNPIESTLTARTLNAESEKNHNTYAADGFSVHNFVIGIKTTPDFTKFSEGFTQARKAKGSGVIKVPKGFKLVGTDVGLTAFSDSNVGADGSKIPGIRAGMSQPGGAGTDIIVSDIQLAGYLGLNETYLCLFGFFETDTPEGTYQFVPQLTLTPDYIDGSEGNIAITNGTLADVIIGKADPGVMKPGHSAVVEAPSQTVDYMHAGFYSKSISEKNSISGFVTGNPKDASVNVLTSKPMLAVGFEDTEKSKIEKNQKINQTNILDYKFTLPKNWCGNITDISVSTAKTDWLSDLGNENGNGPFTVILDNGQNYTTGALNKEDSAISAALAAGAHITSITGHAEILAGNSLKVNIKNAVIEEGVYSNEELVPIQLDVHSGTTNTDISVVRHLRYFEESTESTVNFSVKGVFDYDIANTYTQGQRFTTGNKHIILNRESGASDTDGKVILPETSGTVDMKLPTFVVSSVDKGMIDLDQSKIAEWYWKYKVTGEKYYPEITDLGTDPDTGEHLTKLDFSKYTIAVPKDTDVNANSNFMQPEPLPWKVSDVAAPASGTTSKWITQLTDNNKDDSHPIHGGKVYEGSTGMKWAITAPGVVREKVGLSGNKTGIFNFYTEDTGLAGFDRGIRSDSSDDDNSGKVMMSVTNGFDPAYTEAQNVIVLPDKNNGDAFTMVLSGPGTDIQGEGVKLLYSTKSYKLPSESANIAIDLTTPDWVEESNVTDWSAVRTVALATDSLKGKSVMSAYLPVEVSKIEKEQIGEIAAIQSYAHAKGPVTGSELNHITLMKAQIYGTPQIKAHYEETTDGSTSNGTVLEEEITITGENTNGTDPEYGEYKTIKKDIPGFIYKGLAKDSAPETGILTDDTADVVYLYEREEQELQVHYINISGSDKTSDWAPEDGVELKDSLQILTGGSGEEYTNELVIPKGYDLVTADPGATKGTFDIDSKVTQHEYVYVKAQQQKVIYNVIDDTINKTVESEVLFDEGDTDTDLNKKQDDLQKIADSYIPKGYEVVSVDSLPEKFDNDSSVDQLVEIHLSHTLISVTPEEPGKPGQPIDPENPEGPKWPEGTDKDSLSKLITREINYLDKVTEKEVAKQVVQTVGYARTGIVDKTTGELLGYDTTGDGKVDVSVSDEAKAWMSDNNKWDEVISPDLSSKGYGVPSEAKVLEKTIKVDGKDEVVNVYYDHLTISVTPEEPGKPGQPIDPENPEGPKWPEETDQDSLSKSITRKINYLDKVTEKEVAKQVVQTVGYARTGIVDKTTGELLGYDTTGDGKVDISVSDEAKAWMTDNKIWAEVTSPDLTSQGYGEPSIALVEKVDVEVIDKDSNVKVYYDKETPTTDLGQKVTVNYVDTAGKEISDSIILEGKVGDKYKSEQKTIKGYTFVEVEGNATGEFTDKEQTVTYIYSKETTEREETENPKTGSNDKGAGTTSHDSNSGSTLGKIFPKTGEDMQLSAKLMELGMLVVATATGAYLFLKKKVKK